MLASMRLLLVLASLFILSRPFRLWGRDHNCEYFSDFEDCRADAEAEIVDCDEEDNSCLCSAYSYYYYCWDWCPDEPDQQDALDNASSFCEKALDDGSYYSSLDVTSTFPPYTDDSYTYDTYTYDTYTYDTYIYDTYDLYTTDGHTLPEPTFSGLYSTADPATSTTTSASASQPRQTSATPTSTPQSDSASAAQASRHHDNAGAIAGAAVGGFLGAALIALIAFFIMRRRRQQREQEQEGGGGPQAQYPHDHGPKPEANGHAYDADAITAAPTIAAKMAPPGYDSPARPASTAARRSWIPSIFFRKHAPAAQEPTYELAADEDNVPHHHHYQA